MNQWFKEVNARFTKEGLLVNPSKTTILPFTSRSNLPALSKANMNTVQLKISRTAKYLGVTLKGAHLDNILYKAIWALLTPQGSMAATGC